MPAPQATLLKQAVRAKFMSFAIKVPADWRAPTGEGASQFAKAFKDSERNTQPGSPPLFIPATMNKYHTDTQKRMIVDYGQIIDGLCDAICDAWSKWQAAATLVGVTINAAVAAAGQVVGPPWAPFIIAAAPKAKPNHSRYALAVANTLSNAWQTYTATIKVPGLPWYPAFIACPSPVGPPTPNIPTPVATLTQVPTALQPALLKQGMVSALGDPNAPYHDKLFEAIADGFDKVFKVWQASTMVTGVIGTGPVPTFAPPVVPVGPVVAGVGNMTPGGFK